MTDRRWWQGLLLLAALNAALAAALPAVDDEYYYWCWARELSPSYYDHPPMTALLIRASTDLFGHSLFAIRLPAVLSSLVVLLVLRHLTRPSFAFWMLPLPLFVVGAVLVTPDTPLVLFCSLYLLWLTKLHERMGQGGLTVGWWLLGGAILGLGLLSKYTMALVVPAGLLSFALSGRSWRTWLLGYVLHGLVASLGAVPVLAFNLEHDFAPLRFQWCHAMARESASVASFGGFVGGQVLLFGVLPFALLPWVLRHRRELAADPRLRAAACLYVFPLCFFLFKATRGPLEGNWALVSYLGFWPIAAYWFDGVRHSAKWRTFTRLSFGVPIAAVAVVLGSIASPVPLLPPRHDRVGRLEARRQVAAAVADCVREQDDRLPVYAISYQTTAILRYHGVRAHQLDGATRPSHFTLAPRRLADVDEAFVFAEGPLRPEFAPGFGFPEVVRTFPLIVQGRTVERYQLLRYSRIRPCPLTADAPVTTISRSEPSPVTRLDD